MSGVAIIRALLVVHRPVSDTLPINKVISGIIPQGTVLPAIGISSISENEQETIARRLPNKMIRERVQVTVNASDYVSMKRLMKATALGAGVHTGIIAGYKVRSVLPWGVGPEIPPGDDKIFEQSRDFMVTFVEAN